SSSNKLFQNVAAGTYPRFIYKDPEQQYFMYNDDPIFWEYVQSFSTFKKIFPQRLKAEPWKYIRWYFIEKPLYLWQWDIMQGQGDIYVYPVATSLYLNSKLADATKDIMKYMHPFLVALYFIGILLCTVKLIRGSAHKHLFNGPVMLFSTLIYFNFLYTVLCPLSRYSIPLRPLLYLVALWTLKNLIDLVFFKSVIKKSSK
ncbi:hypothetical protein ACFL47_10475, partial [Candidatus Latescibacterota bacterium]